MRNLFIAGCVVYFLAGCAETEPAQVRVACELAGHEISCDSLVQPVRLLEGSRACATCRGGGEWFEAELIAAGDRLTYAVTEPEVIFMVGHYRACPVDSAIGTETHAAYDGATLRFDVVSTLWTPPRSGCYPDGQP